MIKRLDSTTAAVVGHGPRGVRGFTLLEVLVAVLVLSIGLLGLAGLQTFSLRNNHSALMRSQAIVLAYDALDRVRRNRDQSALYNTVFEETHTSTSCSSTCSSSDVAEHDLAAWKAEVGRLPGGTGQITIAANNRATVEVRWIDDRNSTLTVAVETLL